MKHLVLLIITLCFPVLIYTQVVNTEKLRLLDNEKTIIGETALTLGLARNKAGQTLRIGSRLRLELNKNKHRWMILGAYNLTQFTNVDEPGSVPKNFANNAFGHLRYNYTFNERLTWEAFTQTQHDEIQQLDVRTLVGTGPRIQLASTDSSQLYWGILPMYEYERSTNEFPNDIIEKVTLNDFRISTYLSGGFNITNSFSINSVVYYQPNITDWDDFRISSETTLQVNITERLTLNTYFQFIYDDNPPEPVPHTMYTLTNGFSFSF